MLIRFLQKLRQWIFSSFWDKIWVHQDSQHFHAFFLSQETSDKIGRGMAGWGDLAKDLSIDGASAEFFDFVRNQLDQVQMEKYLQDRGFSQGKVTSLLQDMEYTQGVSRMDSIYFRK